MTCCPPIFELTWRHIQKGSSFIVTDIGISNPTVDFATCFVFFLEDSTRNSMTSEEYSFLGRDATSLGIYFPTFRKNEVPSSSGLNI